MELAIITLSIGLLLFSAYLFSSIFNRFQIPDVLFLLIIGLVLGPITDLVDINQFGILGNVFATLTLLIILFDAGLGIRIKGLLKTASRATLLMFATLIGSIIVVTPIGVMIFGLSIAQSALIGLIVGGISAGIVIPIAEKLPVEEETKTMLALESNINDIITVTIFLAFISYLASGFFDFRQFSIEFGLGFITALIVGIFIAIIWSQLLRWIRHIQNNVFMTPALVLIVFGASELLGIPGIIAAFAFGITLGNLQFVRNEKLPEVIDFQEFKLTNWETKMFSGFVFFFKTYFFVYIGLSIPLDNTDLIIWGAAITALLFGVRYVTVNLTANSHIPSFDKKVLIRLLPKGLVGAALVTLIDNQLIQDLTYSIILFSIVFTSILIFLLPSKDDDVLEVTDPNTIESGEKPDIDPVIEKKMTY